MEASIQHRIASLRRELADATRLEAELGQHTKTTVRKSDQAKATSDQETAMLMRRAMYDPSRGNIVSNQKSVIPARRSNSNWIEENRAAFPQEPAVSYLRTKSDEAPQLPRDEDDVYKVLSRAAKPPRKTKAVRPRPPKRNRGISRVQSATQLPKLVESLEAANNAQDRALEASIEAMQKSLEAQRLHAAPERRFKVLFNTDDKVLENRGRPERQQFDRIRAPGIVLAPVLDVLQKYIMRRALYQVRAFAKSVDSLETHFMLYPRAVLGLQARYRGRKDRLRVRKLEEKRAEQRHRASITIQSFWRQCRARLRIVKLRDELRVSAALKVQRVWRSARARRRAWVILRRRIWAIAQVWLSMGVQSSSHVVQSARLSSQEHAALSQVAQVMMDSKERVPELSPHVLSGLLQGVRVAIFVRDTVAQREENLKDEAVRPAESAPERREKEAIRKREIAEQCRRESLRKAEERRKAAEAEQAFMERALREEREQMLQEQRRKAAVQEEASRKLAATRAAQEEKRRRKASEERAVRRTKEREIERRKRALADARRTLNAQCEEDIFALREVHLPSALRNLEFGIAQKRVNLVAEQRKLDARRLAIQAQLKEPLVPSSAKAKLRDALAILTQEESTLASSLRGLDDEHKNGVLLLETSMDEREEEIRAQYAALRRDAENEFSPCVCDGKL